MGSHASTKAVGRDRGRFPSSCLPPVTLPVRKASAITPEAMLAEH